MLTYGFGSNQTQIVSAIKAEIGKPLKSRPDSGIVNIFLDSSYTGTSMTKSIEQAKA
jgi:exosome complex RNA-binding protein Rrp42 (RNase PH superfamily)